MSTTTLPRSQEARPVVRKQQPRYVLTVVNGQVVSTPVDQVRYTDGGRMIAATES